MKFGQDATVIRLVGGIQAMEMQVMMHDFPAVFHHISL